MNFETIKDRWDRRFINDAQLKRMLTLNVITQEQFDALWDEKYPPAPPVEELPNEPPAPEVPMEPDVGGALGDEAMRISDGTE